MGLKNSKHKKWTKLHLAAWEGDDDLARRLIREGADVNAVDICKQTTCLVASFSKTKKI
jgi:ankyrin repeat protein